MCRLIRGELSSGQVVEQIESIVLQFDLLVVVFPTNFYYLHSIDDDLDLRLESQIVNCLDVW